MASLIGAAESSCEPGREGAGHVDGERAHLYELFFGQVAVGQCCRLQFGLSSTRLCVLVLHGRARLLANRPSDTAQVKIRILSSILKARQKERSWEAVGLLSFQSPGMLFVAILWKGISPDASLFAKRK